MSPLIGCGFTSTYALAGTLGAGAALVVALSLAAKAFVARIERPRPPMWQMVALTAFEPLAYLAAPLSLVFLDHLGWGLQMSPSALVLVGLSTAFVCIAGLHGGLLGRVDPDISEARRVGLSLLYSLPVPGIAMVAAAASIML